MKAKSKEEIMAMREGGEILAKGLVAMKNHSQPGISTWEVDQIGHELVMKAAMECGFLGYQGFPGSACISINNEVVHGVPSKKKIIQDGDVVKIDFGVIHQGLNTDACISFIVGENPDQTKIDFLNTVKNALFESIKKAKTGNHLGDISYAVQKNLEAGGATVVRDLTGHGIGKNLHEKPTIFNFGQPGTGMRLYEGQTLAIEPIATMGGSGEIYTDRGDGWTIYSVDGSLGGHFEHTIIVTKNGGEILTPWHEMM